VTGWNRVRLDWLVEDDRQLVDPGNLETGTVFLYSIPSLDECGDGRLEEASSIGSGKILLAGGEVLISKLNPRKSRVLRSIKHAVPTLCSTEFVVVIPTNVNPQFLVYVLRSEIFRQGLEGRTQSVTKSQQRVDLSDITKMWVDVPDEGTQGAIANFLDWETARIDALVTAKRRMTALLMERYQAHHDACFRALGGPKVSLGRFVVGISQGVSPQADDRPAEAGEWGVLKLSSVKRGRFIPAENKVLPPNYPIDRTLIPRSGDLLVTRSNTPDYVGDACAVADNPGHVLLCDLIYRLRLDRRLIPGFASASLLRTEARHHLSANARGTSQSMVKLRGEDVKATPIPVAELDVQAEVISTLRTTGLILDDAVSRLSRQIELLSERRQALITAAVTGQLDIRAVA
jgi:type I restriction enzyme S subunit